MNKMKVIKTLGLSLFIGASFFILKVQAVTNLMVTGGGSGGGADCTNNCTFTGTLTYATATGTTLLASTSTITHLNGTDAAFLSTVSSTGMMQVMGSPTGYGFRHIGGTTKLSSFVSGALAQFGTDTASNLQFYINNVGETVLSTNNFTPTVAGSNSLGSLALPWLDGFFSGTVSSSAIIATSTIVAGTSVSAPTIIGTSWIFAQDLLTAVRLDMGAGEIKGLANNTISFDADSIGAWQTTSVTFSVQGVAVSFPVAVYVSAIAGDIVSPTSSIDLSVKPTALNTVTVYLRNNSSTAFNAGSSTIGVMGISW